MRAQYYYFEKLFSNEEIEEIVQTYSPKVDWATVRTDTNDKAVSDYRTSKVAWVDNNRLISNRISDAFRRANVETFGLDVDYTYPLDIQYTEYESEYKGYYKPHMDSEMFSEKFSDRKLSISILLNDETEYEGGDLKLYFATLEENIPPVLKRKGDAIIFPSLLTHEVTPVTAGVRRSLVAWLEGPRWR